jgi:hypothetical protein
MSAEYVGSPSAQVVLLFKLERPFFNDRLPVKEIIPNCFPQELIPSVAASAALKVRSFTACQLLEYSQVYPCIHANVSRDVFDGGLRVQRLDNATAVGQPMIPRTAG